MICVKLTSAVSRLRQVLAQVDSDLLQKVKAAGFESIEEAIPYARQFKEKTDRYAILSGDLVRNDPLYQNLKSQLSSGELVFSFTNKKALGQMRALVHLVCLRNGYAVQLPTAKNGEEYFEKLVQSPSDEDTYGTRYRVPVRLYEKPKVKAFFALDADTRSKLTRLSK